MRGPMISPGGEFAGQGRPGHNWDGRDHNRGDTGGGAMRAGCGGNDGRWVARHNFTSFLHFPLDMAACIWYTMCGTLKSAQTRR